MTSLSLIGLVCLLLQLTIRVATPTLSWAALTTASAGAAAQRDTDLIVSPLNRSPGIARGFFVPACALAASKPTWHFRT
jgi:hypothetical protein